MMKDARKLDTAEQKLDRLWREIARRVSKLRRVQKQAKYYRSRLSTPKPTPAPAFTPTRRYELNAQGQVTQ